MLTKHKSKGPSPAELFATAVGAVTLFTHAALADTVYRCGNAYSASPQCGHATATEVKPNSALDTMGAEKRHTAQGDLKEAHALEKQRLKAEHQAAQASPVQLSTPNTPLASPAPSNVNHIELIAKAGKHKNKHARQPYTPYFTAVDPAAAPKKKSTAKAVPASSASQP